MRLFTRNALIRSLGGALEQQQTAEKQWWASVSVEVCDPQPRMWILVSAFTLFRLIISRRKMLISFQKVRLLPILKVNWAIWQWSLESPTHESRSLTFQIHTVCVMVTKNHLQAVLALLNNRWNSNSLKYCNKDDYFVIVALGYV